MRYTIGAGTYFGIPVRVHFTFPLILLVFGAQAWFTGTWLDGVRAVALVASVFVCVVLHEFGHSLQVKRYGIQVHDIVLLPIGGMARAERIPENPWQEIVVAISGPLVNFALVAVFGTVVWLQGRSIMVGEDFVVDLLAINVVLGVFNLVPAFPMDGGRILRGLLALRLPYLRATRYARAVGQLIALVFVVAGFMKDVFLMLPVIAVFIFFGGMSEERVIRARWALEGKCVRDFVTPGVPGLRLDDPISAAAPFAATAGAWHRVLPVTDTHGTNVGVVWIETVVAEVTAGRGANPLKTIADFDLPVIAADVPAVHAYYSMRTDNAPYAAVVDGDRFLGLLEASRIFASSRTVDESTGVLPPA